MMRNEDAPPLIRYLGLPLYLFAWLLIGFAYVDFLLNSWPLQLRNLAWRYASEGLFSASVFAIALGLLLMNGTALVGKSYRVLRYAMLMEVCFAFGYVVLALDFAVNARELRETLVSDPQLQLVFLGGAGKVAIKYFATGAVQVLAAIGSWRWIRANPPPLEFGVAPKRPWWLFWWPDPAAPPSRSVGRRSR